MKDYTERVHDKLRLMHMALFHLADHVSTADRNHYQILKECFSKQELVHNVDSFVVFCHVGVVIEPGDVLIWLVNHVNKLARIGELLCWM